MNEQSNLKEFIMPSIDIVIISKEDIIETSGIGIPSDIGEWLEI